MPLPRPPQILGGCFALYDSTFDPDNTGWQVAAIVPYFFYSMAYPAIGIMLFKAHRDKANHMLRVLTVIWVGNFLTKGGSATPLGFLPLIFCATLVPGPFRAVAIALWITLFPEQDPAKMTAFGFVQHNFFLVFNAVIGLLFVRRANRELYGADESA